MHLNNTKRVFKYPYEAGERNKIKLTKQDLEDPYIVEDLRNEVEFILNPFFKIIEEDNTFYLVCIKSINFV